MLREQNREDVDHDLEEVWHLEPEETFYKIFHKFTKMGIEPILKMPKADLETLDWKEEKGDVSSLEKHEIGEIRNLMQHVEYLKEKGDCTEESMSTRNTITRESHLEFKGSPIGTKVLQSSGDLSTKHPLELVGSSGSSGRSSKKITYVESFKRRIKCDLSHFTNFKEGKN